MAESKNRLGELIVGPFREFGKDNASTLAAALAYYAVMSLVPLLLVIVIVTSYFVNGTSAVDTLTSQIAKFTSPQIADFIKSLLARPSNPSSGPIASIITIITLILGASGIFTQLQFSMNRIWNVPTQKNAGIRKTVKNKFVAFLAVIGIGILFVIFLALNSLVGILISNIPAGSQNHLLAVIGNYVFLFIVLTVLIAMVFRIVPDKEITWRDVWLGAAVTTILFLIGRFLIGLYLNFNKTASGYGAAGSLIVLLIWIYYSAQIFFFGAEFTQVYAHTFGTHKDLPETKELENEPVKTGEETPLEHREETPAGNPNP